MPEDMLEDGVIFLAEQANLFQAQTIVYKRLAESASIIATVGEMTHVIPDDQGITLINFKTQDFIIDVSILDIGSGLIIPARRDTIEWKGKKFLVIEMPGIAAYRYSDRYRKRFRIHTKESGDA